MNAYLGEQRGPDGLNVVDTSSLDQGVELVGLVTQSVSRTFKNPTQLLERIFRTVISTPSSARIKAAYEVASSAFDILEIFTAIRSELQNWWIPEADRQRIVGVKKFTVDGRGILSRFFKLRNL